MEEKGVEVAAGGDVPGQVEHLLGVNELRLGVEQGPAAVAYCFAYWQLADLGWRHPVIPDMVFAVRNPERRTFVAEYDRGTETLDKLFEKVRRYGAGLEGFPFEAVLVVTEETRRFDLIARAMRSNQIAVRVLVSTIDLVREAGVFGTSFIELPGGAKRMVLDAVEGEPEE